MARFMLIYRGNATDLAAMSEDEAAKVLQGWKSWTAKVGSALVDVGSPFGEGGALIDDGTTGPASNLTGFSIVAANDLNEATDLADGHPFLSEGRGKYAIDVFELLPVPFE